MAKIQVLDDHLTNMIAAGEVVERPANIVKECVENSLDAGASSVDIQIFQGGIERIIIRDDGEGMDPQDAKLAFCRHATSKLKSEDDLFNIHTMGFRGEALPSIASVADVDLKTDNGETGTHIHYSYGECTDFEETSTSKGTVIDISGLFVKTPARFKYLKKAAYEFSVIADIVNKMALCHPDIRFSLSHDGRPVFHTTGTGSQQEILYQMYGRETAQAAEPFDFSSDDFRITGYAIQPKISRASKYYMYLSINGRMVRSKPIQDAIIEGYSRYMPPGRYPIICLNVQADPQMTDVNVHPGKWEVRISQQSQLLDLIRTSIPNLFEQKITVPEIQIHRSEASQPRQAYQQASIFQSYEKADSVKETPSKAWDQEILRTSPDQPEPEKKEQAEKTEDDWKPQPEPDYTIRYPLPNMEVHQKQTGQKTGSEMLEDLKLIGQLKDSYILCESTQGLVIIDQHAAQERCHYEKLQQQLLQDCSRVQPCMIPILVQVPSSLISQLEVINQQIAPFGLQLELFGTGQVIMRQVPLWMKDVDETAFLQDLLDYFVRHQKVDMSELRKHILASMACHSSIRFNRPLLWEEMEQVIQDLKGCRQPWHCPHGRPTVITLSDKDLRKEFERG